MSVKNFCWIFKASLFILLLSSVLPAQQVPLLVGSDEEQKREMVLTGLQIKVEIAGSVAETEMTMTFYNPHDRQLSGDFYFPLPQGAFANGYALDIDGVMVEGVVVEKKKARVVFEKEIRRGIDPGLVEMTRGNNFRTRIFPLLPKKERKVMVRYISEVNFAGSDAVYLLPLKYNLQVKKFSLKVEVLQNAGHPVVSEGVLAAAKFENWQRGYKTEIRRENFFLNENLKIRLPEVFRQPVSVEKNPAGEYYFVIADKVSAPVQNLNGSKAFRKLFIFWDASDSRRQANLEKELQLLKEYLGGFKKEKIEVLLQLFANEPEKEEHFLIVNGNCQALLERLKRVKYDGGTQLGLLKPLKSETAPDCYFLFSDGLSNFGKEEPPEFNAPLYVFCSDARANHSFLDYLAQKNGGIYFNLLNTSVQSALKGIGRTPFRFISLVCNRGEIEEYYPRQSIIQDERIIVVGKFLTAELELTLNFGSGKKVLLQKKYLLKRSQANSGRVITIFWAQRKLEHLLTFARRNEQEILETGKRYNLVTPQTSLIVLERLSQYLEYRIVPPESKPQWREEYFRKLKDMENRGKELKKSKLERVRQLWAERVAWWQTDFSKQKPEKKELKESVARELDVLEGGVEGGVLGGVEAGVEESEAQRAPASGDSRVAYKRASGKSDAAAEIRLQPWNPETPYLKAIRAVSVEEAYEVYLSKKEEFGNAPSFFLDCADFFLEKKQNRIALRILSNIAEMELENAQLLRVLAHRLAQLGYLELSALIFEEVLKMRPEEPQSYRDLALVLAELKQYQRAVELLNQVVMNEWDRFEEIEVVALMEMNNIIARARRAGITDFNVAEDLILLLDVDLRIVLTWDADLTDIDLHVIEPTQEEAFYSHNRTSIGGLVSRDFTNGYGPEEYLIRKARPGKYLVKVNYYGSQAQTLLGAVTIQVTIFTGYGCENEQKKSVTMRLTDRKEMITVVEVEF